MSHLMDPTLETLRGALAGRFSLQHPIGRGGMGVVYLARDLRLDRLVAIKCLLPGRAADPVARERFLREARTAAGLFHPHIVPVFAVDEADEFICIVMAYVEGRTLAERIRVGGPLAPPEGARLLRQVASALAYAHERGVVHRDVKPDNILLEAGTGRAIVTDFGIARIGGDAGGTGPHMVLGTPEFISPEQAAGRPADGRSDLYALGVVGFYSLSGLLPFTGEDERAVLTRQIVEPAPAIASVVPGLPPRLAAAIDGCLRKDPDRRFQTGAALAELLAPLAAAVGGGDAPIAVRAFLTRSRHLSGPTLAYAALAGGLLGNGAAVVFLYMDDPRLRLLALAALLGAALLPLGVALGRVRRLLTAGHGRDDLVRALQTEWERRCEELAFTYGARASRFERFLRLLAWTGLGVAAGAVGLAFAHPVLGAALPEVPLAFWAAEAASLLAAIVARARHEQRTDPKGERRLRLWHGPVGRLLFRLAAPRPRVSPIPISPIPRLETPT